MRPCRPSRRVVSRPPAESQAVGPFVKKDGEAIDALAAGWRRVSPEPPRLGPAHHVRRPAEPARGACSPRPIHPAPAGTPARTTSRESLCSMARCASPLLQPISPASWRRRASLRPARSRDRRTTIPSGLPLPGRRACRPPEGAGAASDCRTWSEGQVWCSPERHGAMTGIMKAQIDWIPLALGAVRPTQGKTLAVTQVSGGSQSFNAHQPAARARPLDADDHHPQSILVELGEGLGDRRLVGDRDHAHPAAEDAQLVDGVEATASRRRPA